MKIGAFNPANNTAFKGMMRATWEYATKDTVDSIVHKDVFFDTSNVIYATPDGTDKTGLLMKYPVNDYARKPYDPRLMNILVPYDTYMKKSQNNVYDAVKEAEKSKSTSKSTEPKAS